MEDIVGDDSTAILGVRAASVGSIGDHKSLLSWATSPQGVLG